MINVSLKKVLFAALCLALVPAAAPIALADVPGSVFLDFDRQPAASSNGKAAPAPTAGNDNADAAKSPTPRTSSDPMSMAASEHADHAQGYRPRRTN